MSTTKINEQTLTPYTTRFPEWDNGIIGVATHDEGQCSHTNQPIVVMFGVPSTGCAGTYLRVKAQLANLN